VISYLPPPSEPISALDLKLKRFVTGSFDATLRDAADWQQR